MKILFCASEAYPFAKSGGLADVAYALPRAMAKKEQVTLLLPWYRFSHLPKEPSLLFETVVTFGGNSYALSFYRLEFAGLKVVLVRTPLLYERETLYGEGGGYGDNDLRFTLFSRAIVLFAKEQKFDIVHLNDWHTALAALFAKEQKLFAKIVFTIHNLAFQGVFPKERMEVLGLDAHYFHMELLEFYGQINFMKAGIVFCDALTTVSPTYAKEILTPEFGFGLEGFLQKYSFKLSGIVNGIDTVFFDPKTDPMLTCRLKRKVSTFKKCNQKAFWGSKSDLPLFVFIGRLTEQKGVDLLLALHEQLSSLPLRLALLGDGDDAIAAAFEQMAQAENIRFFRGYKEDLAHQMYAAADFLLMPSRFEPCGLNQMIAMRYGAIPVVRQTGGLADTVHEKGKKCGKGIVFAKAEATALQKALKKALKLYAKQEKMEAIRAFDVACDFSFAKSAKKYLKLYRQLEKESV